MKDLSHYLEQFEYAKVSGRDAFTFGVYEKIASGDTFTVRQLLNDEIISRKYHNKCYDNNYFISLLHVACLFKKYDIIDLLFKHGFNGDEYGKNLITFMLCDESEDENDFRKPIVCNEVILYLTEKDMYANDIDDFNDTPLKQAIGRKNYELMYILLDSIYQNSPQDLEGDEGQEILDFCRDNTNNIKTSKAYNILLEYIGDEYEAEEEDDEE